MCLTYRRVHNCIGGEGRGWGVGIVKYTIKHFTKLSFLPQNTDARLKK